MRLLSNENLIETYYIAVNLNLDEDFIQLLQQEITRRNLELQDVATYLQ